MTSTEDAVALLPCPFCGGEAKRITIDDQEPNNAGGDCIICTRCQCSSHVEFGRKENLVSRWNTRVTKQKHGDDVERVIAKRIHEAMVWAALQHGPPKAWCNGNSYAEDEARAAARAALDALHEEQGR